MSNATSLGRIRSSDSFFGRILALVASALDKSASIAARNSDQPYFGL